MKRIHHNVAVVLLLSSLAMEAYSTASQNELHSVTIGGCLGQTVTFECNVVGQGYTVWAGSAFIQGSDITLRHAEFADKTAVGECNNGGIVGRGIRANGSIYTSHLNVTLTPEVIGKTVSCSFDDGSENTPVGQLALMVSNKPFSAPAVSTSIKADRITFSWNQTSPDHQALTFNTTTVNCGTCTTDTASSSTTCTNFVVSRNSSICQFMVQSVICGNITGNASTATKLVNLKLPDTPVLQTLPYYLDRPRNILTKLFTTYNLSHPIQFISNDVNSSTINYTVTYSDSISGSIYSSVSIPVSSCFNGQCNHTFDALTSLCPPPTGINVSILATNVFGNGPTIAPSTNDVNNTFVEVIFDHTTSFRCTFHNQPQDYIKRCNVSIARSGNCDKPLGIYSSSGIGDSIQTPPLILNLTSGINKFCFSVNASSGGSRTVIVEGTLNIANIDVRKINLPAAVSIPTVIIIILLSIMIAVTLGIILRNLYHDWKRPPITIKFSVKNEVGKLAKALEVFKNHKVDILGVNTHLHHPSFDRGIKRGYRDNYVYCVCSNEKLERLKRERELEDVECVHDVSEPDTHPRTIKFRVKHEPGALYEALSKISSQTINILGLNTRSSHESVTHGYKDNYVKCKCSERMQKIICKDLEEIGGALNVIVEYREEKIGTARQCKLVVRDKIGSIAGAVQVFSECGINIDVINKRYIPDVKRDAKMGYPFNFVECQCAEDQRDDLCREIENLGADKAEPLSEVEIREITGNENYNFRNEEDFCVIQFHILNEAGALARALNAFAVKRINIIGVNTLFHQPPNNAQQDQQNDRVTRPIYSYNCVKYRSINDQKFNELKQKLTAAGFELDTEQVNRHSTEYQLATREVIHVGVLEFWITDQMETLKTAIQVFTELEIKIIEYLFDFKQRKKDTVCKHSYVDFKCTDEQKEQLENELRASSFVVRFHVSESDPGTP